MISDFFQSRVLYRLAAYNTLYRLPAGLSGVGDVYLGFRLLLEYFGQCAGSRLHHDLAHCHLLWRVKSDGKACPLTPFPKKNPEDCSSGSLFAVRVALGRRLSEEHVEVDRRSVLLPLKQGINADLVANIAGQVVECFRPSVPLEVGASLGIN